MKSLLRVFLTALVIAGVTATALCEEKTAADALRLMQQGNAKESIQIFETLSAKGDTKAMVQLGVYYYEGTGVVQDYAKAMDWWLRAFTNQNADAFVNLGVMHRDGQGVPENKKIAYCVFLTTHMCGLGSESTQMRANSCLRRIQQELTKDDIKDCLSNYTLGYIKAYIQAKGKMNGVPEKYRPSKQNPALRDLDWWLDGELDAIYGPPTAAEKKAREAKAKERENELATLQHTLVFQIRFPKEVASHYPRYTVITDEGMGSRPISEKDLQPQGKYLVYQGDALVYAEQRRYITVGSVEHEALVYRIEHPVKSTPCDWTDWQKPEYGLKDQMDEFALLSGGDPKSKAANLPNPTPELRFKVVKKNSEQTP
jgi:hypothetical protein